MSFTVSLILEEYRLNLAVGDEKKGVLREGCMDVGLYLAEIQPFT